MRTINKKKLMYFQQWIFIAVLFFATTAMAGDKITLATLDWEPYIGQNMPDKGYVYEIVVAALKKSGCTAEMRFYPWARSLYLTKSGLVDALFPEYYDKGREIDYVFSDPFPGGPVGFYKRKDKNISYSVDPRINQIEALRGLKQYHFGIVRGYINTAEFDAATFLKKEEVSTDEINLKKLYHDRIQLIFIDKFVAQHIIATKYPQYKDELEFMEPPLEEKLLYVAFSKKAGNYENKLKSFNSGLKQIKEDGTMQKILQKHRF